MRPLSRLVLAGLALNLLLVLPAWWRDGQVGSVWLAPEAWLLPALVALLPGGRFGQAMRLALAALLGLLIIAGFSDALVYSVLGRGLNVFIDSLMLGAGFNLIQGSVGWWAAILAAVVIVLAVAGIGWGVWRLLCAADRAPAGAALAVFGACLVAGLPWVSDRLPGVAPQLPGMIAQQAGQLEQTRRDRAELIAAQGDPAFSARALPGLVGRDVYIVFIESYGASVLDQPRYADRIVPQLRRFQDGLDSAGLSAVSGRVEAPIRGGQSWLSHASLLSGLAIDNQLWYRMLLARDIDLLTADFRASGHVTLKLAPAIVDDWPEGEQLGFDHVYAAGDLGYRGPRLGWATMPDEFTLHSFSERIRPRFDAPVFAQIALISSHWPWTPVIEPTPEPSQIGDGRRYERWRGEGADPVSMLFDPPGQREAYLASIEYSLGVALDWARRSLPQDALLILLGDHQPTTLITGRHVGASVPVHVISGAPGLLDGFEQRGFAPGLVPGRTGENAGMERLRQWLRNDFGSRGDLP